VFQSVWLWAIVLAVAGILSLVVSIALGKRPVRLAQSETQEEAVTETVA
jgi:hypothetical protein